MIPNTKELDEAVSSTTWEIEVEVNRDGTHTEIKGSFTFRDGMVIFKTSHPDFELELDELEDYPEGEEPSAEVVAQALSHVEKAISERLQTETESEIDSAEYNAADDEYHRKVGTLRYHGLNYHDF